MNLTKLFKTISSEHQHLHSKRKLNDKFNCNPWSGLEGTTEKLDKKHVLGVRTTNQTELFKIVFK